MRPLLCFGSFGSRIGYLVGPTSPGMVILLCAGARGRRGWCGATDALRGEALTNRVLQGRSLLARHGAGGGGLLTEELDFLPLEIRGRGGAELLAERREGLQDDLALLGPSAEQRHEALEVLDRDGRTDVATHPLAVLRGRDGRGRGGPRSRDGASRGRHHLRRRWRRHRCGLRHGSSSCGATGEAPETGFREVAS